MGKNKLKKFAEMEQLTNVFQYSYNEIVEKGEMFEMRGHWGERVFKNNNPIVLELGCGKGEYAVGLARRYPDKNFIGVDIKGARMWWGAKEAHTDGLTNCAFLRTGINVIDHFFEKGEVSEIWITFADPQMKKLNKRLTSTHFLNLYKKILADDGIIRLKSDSNFLYTYTKLMAEASQLPIIEHTDNLYLDFANKPEYAEMLEIKTYYERQWIARGLDIKYIAFTLNSSANLIEPNVEIEYDDYRSFGRKKRSELDLGI